MNPEELKRARALLLSRGLIGADATDAQVETAAMAARREALGAENGERSESLTTRAVTMAPTTLDEATRSMDVTLATESRVRMVDWGRYEYVDEVLLMSGYQANEVRRGTLPMLDTHDRSTVDRVLGSIDNLRVEGAELAGRARFSAVAERAWTLAKEGHLNGISAGYRVLAATYIEPGKTMTINGRTWTASDNRALKLVTSWYPAEGSLCAIGADGASGTRAADDNDNKSNHNPITKPQPEETDMNREQIIALLTERGYDRAAAEHWATHALALPADKQRSFCEALPVLSRTAPAPAAPAPATAPAAAPAGNQRTAEQERERIQALLTSQRSLPGLFPQIPAEEIRTAVDAAIADGSEANAVRLALLERAAAAQNPVNQAANRTPVQVVADNSDNVRELISTVVQHRANVPNRKLNDQQRTHVQEYGNLSLIRCAELMLQQHGIRTIGLSYEEIYRRAITHGTGDFASALLDAANKSLQAYYMIANSTFERWADIVPVSDFKTQNIVSFSLAGELTEIPSGGEIPMHTFSDSKETMKLKTFGHRFGISRQAIVNDDLAVFNNLARAYGISARLTVNRTAIKVLLTNAAMTDGNALFSTAHANVDTSLAAATTQATALAILESLKKKLMLQKDKDGVTSLNLMPKVLLCGPSQVDYFAQAIAERGRADNNAPAHIQRLGLDLVTDANIEDTTISGAADLSILFADPMMAAVVKVGFLNGNQAPMVTTRDSWDVDGTEFRVLHDHCAGVADYRGAAKHDAP